MSCSAVARNQAHIYIVAYHVTRAVCPITSSSKREIIAVRAVVSVQLHHLRVLMRRLSGQAVYEQNESFMADQRT